MIQFYAGFISFGSLCCYHCNNMECPKKIALVLSMYLAVGCVHGFPCTSEDWCYNTKNGTCEELSTGTCTNISMSFCSKEKCEQFFSREKVCKPFTYYTNVTCRSALARWTYAEEKNECEIFYYGGCGGSENNFATKSACKHKCVQDTTCTEKWCYDIISGECNAISKDGLRCHNMNISFCDKDSCSTFYNREYVCRPLTYKTEQRCKAIKERWTYVEANNSCETFNYGGCGGTENNFESNSTCQLRCIRGTQAGTSSTLAALIGIIIGGVIGLGIVGGAIIICYRQRKRGQKRDALEQQAKNSSAVKASYGKQTKSPEFDQVCYTSIDQQKVEKA